jgi:hypothetical protein
VLALPVVVLLLLLVLQVGLVARSQVLVVDAAREGARAAAVGEPNATVTRAARSTPGLDPRRLSVAVDGGEGGDLVRVTVTYRAATDVALIGPMLGDRTLTATVAMRREGAPDP